MSLGLCGQLLETKKHHETAKEQLRQYQVSCFEFPHILFHRQSQRHHWIAQCLRAWQVHLLLSWAVCVQEEEEKQYAAHAREQQEFAKGREQELLEQHQGRAVRAHHVGQLSASSSSSSS